MNQFLKKHQALIIVLVIGAFITPGLIILAWRFQLMSYMLLAKYCLILFLPISLGVLLFNRLYPISLQDLFHKQLIFKLVFSLASSLIVTRYRSDLIRYFLAVFFLSILVFLIVSIFMKRSKTLFNVLFFLVGFFGVSIFIYMAYFVRLYGDDFCFAIRIVNNGLLKTMVDFYQDWSGRLFSNLFMYGFSSTNKIVLIEISIMILIIFYALRLIRSDTFNKFSFWNLSAALFLPFAVFSALPEPYKSLYWIANAQLIFPVSTLIIVLITFLSHGFIKGFNHEIRSIIVTFLMCITISNGHEILAPAMLFMTFSLLIYSLIFRKNQKTNLIISLSALSGTIAGILILVLAPGNYVRMAAQGYPPTPDLFSAIHLSLGYYLEFLVKLKDAWKWVLIAAAFTAGITAETILPRGWRYFAAILLTAVVSSWGTFLISAFAMSATLPTRTQFFPVFFLIIGFFALGATIPAIKSSPVVNFSAIIVLILFGFVFSGIIKNDAKLVAPMVQFSVDWDKRDRDVRINNFESYEISIPWDYREQQLHCVANYYALQK